MFPPLVVAFYQGRIQEPLHPEQVERLTYWIIYVITGEFSRLVRCRPRIEDHILIVPRYTWFAVEGTHKCIRANEHPENPCIKLVLDGSLETGIVTVTTVPFAHMYAEILKISYRNCSEMPTCLR